MQINSPETSPIKPVPPGAGMRHGDARRPVTEHDAAGAAAAADPEALALNLDASLRVYARHQLFSWTQGALQALIPHELLVCALRNGGPDSFFVDSFSTALVDAGRINDAFRQDASLVPQLIKLWEDNHCQAVTLTMPAATGTAASALMRELERIDAPEIIAHGTYDAAGQLASFFLFACRPGSVGSHEKLLVDRIVPFLHSAWIRTQVDWLSERPGIKSAATGLLTAREREILQWIYHGKSNIEVGMILKISPLTVKNHVQKILRKLNVLNRTQAIGKALALRILNI